MRLTSVTENEYPSKILRFTCEYDVGIPEEARFAKATPAGSFEMHVDNPLALEQFEIGKKYYFDITPAT